METLKENQVEVNTLSATQWNQQQKDIMAKVRQLSEVNSFMALRPMVIDWLIIGAAVGLSLALNSWIVYFASCLVIATRQHALLVLVHEASHFRLTRSRKLNDFIANVFAAYPIFFCVRWYRQNHQHHHLFLNTEKDPDWSRKIHHSDWKFPQSRSQLLITLARAVLLGGFRNMKHWVNIWGIFSKKAWREPAERRFIIGKIIFYGLSVAVMHFYHLELKFLAYWLVPYLFFLPVVDRIRSISEHFGLERNHTLNQARDVTAPAIEKFLFSPHNINLHLVHHLYPTVSQYHLPKLHSFLRDQTNYLNWAHQNSSYFMGGDQPVILDILNAKT